MWSETEHESAVFNWGEDYMECVFQKFTFCSVSDTNMVLQMSWILQIFLWVIWSNGQRKNEYINLSFTCAQVWLQSAPRLITRGHDRCDVQGKADFSTWGHWQSMQWCWIVNEAEGTDSLVAVFLFFKCATWVLIDSSHCPFVWLLD